ncbi:hypothetical protein BJX65DRAFT_317151 [Aspergillus insuetus]
MEFDPQIPGYLTSDPSSFAYVSVRERWLVILDGIIDDLTETVNGVLDAVTEVEGKWVIDRVVALKADILLDAKLKPLLDDRFDDIFEYNKELNQRNATWMDVFWLYSECYLYRRINTLFTLTEYWRDYDPFRRQKMSTFKASRPAVLELATKYRELVSGDTCSQRDEEAEMLLFREMCEVCLWGNATDLSLLTSVTYENLQKLQGAGARQAQRKNILSNDLDAAFTSLKTAHQSRNGGEIRVDFVLDNAGFELFADLILAGYLLSTGLATKIVLHPKSIPWFVSDALPVDFDDVLAALLNPRAFFRTQAEGPVSEAEEQSLKFLGNQWSGFHQKGKIVVREDRFWTTGGSFWRLPHLAPDLFDELKTSDLVIFKGDLNYRKLTGDAHWNPTTPFSSAIGPLGPGSKLRTLVLRTCKADVVVGLAEGDDERLRNTPEGGFDKEKRRWAWTGKFAVASLCDGKA